MSLSHRLWQPPRQDENVVGWFYRDFFTSLYKNTVPLTERVVLSGIYTNRKPEEWKCQYFTEKV